MPKKTDTDTECTPLLDGLVTKAEQDLAEEFAGKMGKIVDGWFLERIHGGAVGRFTEAYNALYEALPDLKARLARAVKE